MDRYQFIQIGEDFYNTDDIQSIQFSRGDCSQLTATIWFRSDDLEITLESDDAIQLRAWLDNKASVYKVS